ncbi:type VI secretion system protein ImpD [Sinobacterium caligoides]|uniref:Type VI secretion system protein ImpD n=1 Tax=Sinobacterium caligoides TaxID=933926 RepID=A0A3N2DJR4_9GAMM|nr:type VI secretion system contractile sheath large subunit [Sinobacterium caligoides]ROS00043.1 type VI secretion system protein ImpD [Sinobacterium caligoides]
MSTILERKKTSTLLNEVDVYASKAPSCRQSTTSIAAEFAPDLDAIALWINNPHCSTFIRNSSVNLWLNYQISLIDELIEKQLNAILHHDKFQALESAWQGLHYLTESTGQNRKCKVKFLDASWRLITKDQQRASEPQQSGLFELVYNKEFGIAGGEPFGALIGDYRVNHMPNKDHPYDDVYTLTGISQVAAASFTSFICGAHPSLFGLDDFQQMNLSINLESIFNHKEYARWNALRNTLDSRFITITLPGILMRQPYERSESHVLNFKENVSSPDSLDYLWGNSAFALGSVLIREFNDVGWFSHIRGVPRDYFGGGLVTAFKCHKGQADNKDKILTPTLITDNMDRELGNLGLLPLCACYEAPFAAFYSSSTLHRSQKFDNKSATANARISAMLQQLLCASRFAHYIKVMIRDKVGSFSSASDCEQQLQSWLNKYSTGGDNLKWETMARYPLNEARVRVSDIRSTTGSYHCSIHLKPHYIVDELISELMLTTEISSLGVTTTS